MSIAQCQSTPFAFRQSQVQSFMSQVERNRGTRAGKGLEDSCQSELDHSEPGWTAGLMVLGNTCMDAYE